MEVVVLSIHLLVCICLIGLVLLQRSEGGALGMGGGGGGALMSGRGAADALAKMTQVAGGFFLVTSLGLTVLSGAGASDAGSILENLTPPARTAPATTPAAPSTTAPAPAEQPAQTRPDPTESSVPATTQLASAPAPDASAPRAAPLSGSPAATPASGNRAVQTAAVQQRQTPPPQPRSAPATTRAASTPPLVLPNSSGAVTGIALDDSEANEVESIDVGNGVEAVRRDQRAGPDQ
ncbi:MAG TPA: preprotein translocase subunit SecG [Vitreimonas sp.]|uniref:preprotein translocase subunit SecG n=1 Tax=Vitreimonas sp. TaxID=3069702 RepID=UPI002D6C4636|nr:preprotein translocase subunit SecG [Vitreimonas sp.]HYD87493.1 preprotein translocase subunit SecG [Vitreimonas sp.]